jgi:hypothetical protein
MNFSKDPETEDYNDESFESIEESRDRGATTLARRKLDNVMVLIPAMSAARRAEFAVVQTPKDDNL